MIKLRLVVLLGFVLMGGSLSAQYSQNALGIRFSGNDDQDEYEGVGTAVSYQRAFSESRRGELNLGFRDSRWLDVVTLTGVYQWVWNIKGGLNWYLGPAAGVGIVDYDNGVPWANNPDWDDDRDVRLLTSLGGDIGIEYVFSVVPIQVALDLRPQFYMFDVFYDDDFDANVGVAVRWQFD